MEVTTIKCEKRTEVGSRVARQMRVEGQVPAVVYGGGGESVSIAIQGSLVERELRHHHRVFKLEFGGQSESVYMQDAQFDVLTDYPLHLDFLRIDLQKPLSLEVEINWIGHPAGASKGGRLVRDRNTIQVNVPPTAVPHDVSVQVSAVDLGDQVTAGDVTLPEGVTLNCPPETLLAHMPGDD